MKFLLLLILTCGTSFAWARHLSTLPVKGKVLNFDEKQIELMSQNEILLVPRGSVKKRDLKKGDEVIADLTLDQFANLKTK